MNIPPKSSNAFPLVHGKPGEGMTLNPLSKKACVIVHPEMGVYLGSCLGLGFWSKLDPVGQAAAATFDSVEDAETFMGAWESGRPAGVTFTEVVPDLGTHASPEACVAAGLDRWDPDASRIQSEDLGIEYQFDDSEFLGVQS